MRKSVIRDLHAALVLFATTPQTSPGFVYNTSRYGNARQGY